MEEQHLSMPVEAYLVYELTLALAAPKVLARAPKIPSQSEVLDSLDDVLDLIAEMRSPPAPDTHLQRMQCVQPYLVELRAACASWEPSHSAPLSLQLLARRAMSLGFGVSEPVEGWDQFDLSPPEPTTESSIGTFLPEGISMSDLQIPQRRRRRQPGEIF